MKTSIDWLFEEIRPCICRDEVCDLLYELRDELTAKHKEEMIAFAEFVAKHPDKNRNVNNEMLHAKSKYDEAETTLDLLDKFYNKTNEDGTEQN